MKHFLKITWEKFIEPKKLIKFAEKNNLSLIKIDGVKFNPIVNEWKISKDKSINYISNFKKS